MHARLDRGPEVCHEALRCHSCLAAVLGVAALSVSAIAAPPRQTASATATVHFKNSTTDLRTVNIEAVSAAGTGNDTDYLPNVVQSENGAGTLQSLMVQAIAARSFLYYKLNLQGYIGDGENDQVYSGYGYGNPTALQILAVQLTNRIVLRYGNGSNDQTIAGFFVAGAVPTAANVPFGQPATNAASTGNTQPDVTYNRGLVGNDITQTPLGYVAPLPSGNILNRGAMSQNGSNFLANNTVDNFNYSDILRYYYGADIHMEVAAPTSTADRQGPLTVERFDVDQGTFGNNVLSANNVNVAAVTRSYSTDSHSAAVASGQPKGSQQIAITAGPVAGVKGAFGFYDVSGLGPNSITQADGVTAGQGVAGSASTNLSMPSIGSISYWLKVINADAAATLSTDILLNNDSGTVQTSVSNAIIADGQWHQYQYFVNDPAAFLRNFGTASTSSYFSVNSIGLFGVGNATVELDDLVYNQQAVPEPAMLGAIGLAAVGLLRRRATVD